MPGRLYLSLQKFFVGSFVPSVPDPVLDGLPAIMSMGSATDAVGMAWLVWHVQRICA